MLQAVKKDTTLIGRLARFAVETPAVERIMAIGTVDKMTNLMKGLTI